MIKQPFIAVFVLSLATLACGINITLPSEAIEIGPMVTEEINVPSVAGNETTELTISFGAGELQISPGEINNLVSGTAMYNVEEFKPEFTVSGNVAELRQGSFDYEFTGLPNFDDMENKWDLKLGSDPIDLIINAGAFSGIMDLGGLYLENLEIFGGASSVEINFTQPNLTEMNTFRYTTGASDIDLNNLGNANFEFMDFDCGVGNYTLDFSGDLQRDAKVEINAGLSNIILSIPENIPATVTVTGGLSTTNILGAWSGSDNVFSQPGEGPSLEIEVEIGAGNLDLEN